MCTAYLVLVLVAHTTRRGGVRPILIEQLEMNDADGTEKIVVAGRKEADGVPRDRCKMACNLCALSNHSIIQVAMRSIEAYRCWLSRLVSFRQDLSPRHGYPSPPPRSFYDDTTQQWMCWGVGHGVAVRGVCLPPPCRKKHSKTWPSISTRRFFIFFPAVSRIRLFTPGIDCGAPPRLFGAREQRGSCWRARVFGSTGNPPGKRPPDRRADVAAAGGGRPERRGL